MKPIRIYKSYVFHGKDPIIAQLRTAVGKMPLKQVEEESGVRRQTMHNWFKGETRRPQFATAMAVARAAGYDLKLVKQ